MRRITLCLLFSLCLGYVGAATAWAAAPVIEDVQIDRGRDTDAPNWPCYHQRVYVRASDADGAADIAYCTITDPDGAVHTVPPEGGYWQEDAYTMACEWSEWGLLDPPAGGTYAISVHDASANADTLISPPAPSISEIHSELLSPPMDGVIYETEPTFEWTSGIPGSQNNLHLEEEGTWGEIWAAGLGTGTSALYDFDETAARDELLANHSYFWMVDSWYPDDDRVSDPRVSIWTAQHTHGRFTVYGDWPELPPELPGKLAYGANFWGERTGTYPPEWGMGSMASYNRDPHARVWLGADWSGSPDWSPDGSELLYTKAGRIWIDALDGSAPTEIPGAAGWGDCRWAADGARVVYAVDGPPSPYTPWNQDIWIANSDGSNMYPLVEDIESQDRYPVWGPDGLWLAYRKIPDPDPSGVGLHLVRYDGTEDHALVASGLTGYPDHEVVHMGEPDWSPDGLEIAVSFQAVTPGAVYPEEYLWGIGTISRDGGPLFPVFVTPLGIVCCGASRLPQWSPDGTKIVFSAAHHLPDPPGYAQFEPGVELWLANADGTGDPVRLTYDYSHDGFCSWWAPNTEPGTDVSVVSGDTTVTFETVTGSGSTTAVTFDDPPGPEPEGFQFLGDYYDISTDAEISGTITIEIHYDDADVPGGEEEWLSLLHWETDHWEDITVRPIDTVNNIITGQCTSLSAFGIAFGPQFQGLLPPVNNDGSSVFKLNRTVPVKFQLIAPDGSFVTDAVARLYLAKVSSDVVGTFEEADSTGKADTGNTFRYDAEADQYIFNLGTKGLSTGTWVIQVVVNDMVAKEVWISLR